MQMTLCRSREVTRRSTIGGGSSRCPPISSESISWSPRPRSSVCSACSTARKVSTTSRCRCAWRPAGAWSDSGRFAGLESVNLDRPGCRSESSTTSSITGKIRPTETTRFLRARGVSDVMSLIVNDVLISRAKDVVSSGVNDVVSACVNKVASDYIRDTWTSATRYGYSPTGAAPSCSIHHPGPRGQLRPSPSKTQPRQPQQRHGQPRPEPQHPHSSSPRPSSRHRPPPSPTECNSAPRGHGASNRLISGPTHKPTGTPKPEWSASAKARHVE